jgi:serine/threonine protein kinase
LVDLHGVGMTHRNIKPSNILTNTVGEVKISDFGMTKGEFIVNNIIYK